MRHLRQESAPAGAEEQSKEPLYEEAGFHTSTVQSKEGVDQGLRLVIGSIRNDLHEKHDIQAAVNRLRALEAPAGGLQYVRSLFRREVSDPTWQQEIETVIARLQE